MAYIPTIWESGDIVTSEKLNKLENGVKYNSDKIIPLIVNLEIEYDSSEINYISYAKCDKTFSEIFNSPYTLFIRTFDEDGNHYKLYGFSVSVLQANDDYTNFVFELADNNNNLAVEFEGSGDSYPEYTYTPEAEPGLG